MDARCDVLLLYDDLGVGNTHVGVRPIIRPGLFFMCGGGDTFTGFAAQRDAVIGISDLEATEAWVKALPARAVPAADRTFDADR